MLIGLDIPDDCVAQLGMPCNGGSLTRYLARPNERGLQAALLQSPDRYPLICAPETPAEVMEYETKGTVPQLLQSLLYAVRSREYLGIVVDVPPGYSNWSIKPMAMASLVVLVVEPDPANVRKAVIGLRDLARYAGIAPQKVNLVLNKVPPNSPVSPSEVQRDMIEGLEPTPRPDAGDTEKDLREFCTRP